MNGEANNSVIERGKLMREARERRGLTQQQVADAVGTSQQTVDRLESGVIDRSTFAGPILQLLEISDRGTCAARLKTAREMAGFESASAACERFGWSYPTYTAHENGGRGIGPSQAKQYALAFKTNAAWIMFGDGDGQGENCQPVERIEPATPDKVLMDAAKVLSDFGFHDESKRAAEIAQVIQRVRDATR